MSSEPSEAVSDRDDAYEPDPIVTSARREAVQIMLLWLSALAWTMWASHRWGYLDPAAGTEQDIPLLLGFPAWIVKAVLAPWIVCSAVTIWFCLVRMEDGDLDEGAMPDAAAADSAEGAQS